jgi:hypothetical protein
MDVPKSDAVDIRDILMDSDTSSVAHLPVLTHQRHSAYTSPGPFPKQLAFLYMNPCFALRRAQLQTQSYDGT